MMHIFSYFQDLVFDCILHLTSLESFGEIMDILIIIVLTMTSISPGNGTNVKFTSRFQMTLFLVVKRVITNENK